MKTMTPRQREIIEMCVMSTGKRGRPRPGERRYYAFVVQADGSLKKVWLMPASPENCPNKEDLLGLPDQERSDDRF